MEEKGEMPFSQRDPKFQPVKKPKNPEKKICYYFFSSKCHPHPICMHLLQTNSQSYLTSMVYNRVPYDVDDFFSSFFFFQFLILLYIFVNKMVNQYKNIYG